MIDYRVELINDIVEKAEDFGYTSYPDVREMVIAKCLAIILFRNFDLDEIVNEVMELLGRRADDEDRDHKMFDLVR